MSLYGGDSRPPSSPHKARRIRIVATCRHHSFVSALCRPLPTLFCLQYMTLRLTGVIVGRNGIIMQYLPTRKCVDLVFPQISNLPTVYSCVLSHLSSPLTLTLSKMYELSSLPPEILREVLLYLPIPSLLRFGETSKHHRALQQVSLSKLRLGVFPTRLDGLLSLMETVDDVDDTHSVQRILEKRRTRNKDMIMFNQNLVVARILHKYSASLRDLEISLWDLQQPSAEALAKLKGLRRLSIRLDHPTSRCTDMHHSFWCHSPGSTVWNHLYAKTRGMPVFGRLTSISLERAGITDYQLLRLLEANPDITEIRLRKCLTLSDEFFRGLSQGKLGKQVRILHFTQCESPRIDGRILKYIEAMTSLEVRHIEYNHRNSIADSILVIVILCMF